MELQTIHEALTEAYKNLYNSSADRADIMPIYGSLVAINQLIRYINETNTGEEKDGV
jgi:folylpolyglutamate synthase/dihydropteroate synthase